MAKRNKTANCPNCDGTDSKGTIYHNGKKGTCKQCLCDYYLTSFGAWYIDLKTGPSCYI